MNEAFPFDSEKNRRDAHTIGMWLFVANELLLFGGLFLVIFIVRVSLPDGAAAASAKIDMWLGGANSAILLTSSCLVGIGLIRAEADRRKAAGLLFALGAVLGTLFLAIKLGIEYRKEAAEGLIPGFGPEFPLSEPGAQLFMNLYLTATSLHAIHLLIGVVLLAWMAFSAWLAKGGLTNKIPSFRMMGLYWHFVDFIWIFLYPALYLVS